MPRAAVERNRAVRVVGLGLGLSPWCPLIQNKVANLKLLVVLQCNKIHSCACLVKEAKGLCFLITERKVCFCCVFAVATKIAVSNRFKVPMAFVVTWGFALHLTGSKPWSNSSSDSH